MCTYSMYTECVQHRDVHSMYTVLISLYFDLLEHAWSIRFCHSEVLTYPLNQSALRRNPSSWEKNRCDSIGADSVLITHWSWSRLVSILEDLVLLCSWSDRRSIKFSGNTRMIRTARRCTRCHVDIASYVMRHSGYSGQYCMTLPNFAQSRTTVSITIQETQNRMLLRLYDDCGVNPLGGWVAWRAVSSLCPSWYLLQWRLRCVPSLVQFPIFIGLYRSILKLSQINPRFQAQTVFGLKARLLRVFQKDKQSKSHACCQRS